MNVVVLNDFAYVDGGASKIALGSAKALAGRGHQVTLFAAVGPMDASLLEVPGLKVICLQQHEIVSDPNRMQAVIRGFWNRTAEARFRSLLSTFRPSETVVHLHTWTKALSSSVVRTATDLGFPIVLTLHDYFSVCPTGSFYIHPKQEICHLRPMSAACISTNCDSRSYSHKLWRVGRQWTQSHVGRLPAGIMDYISISDLSEEVLTSLLPSGARFHHVPNFIDTDQSAHADVGHNHLFSFVGRLSPEKGPRLLAECARLLDLRVQFIGDGPMKQELARVASNALFTGWVPPEIAREKIRQSRALIFPSLWYETQGLVVAEAAAMGVPVIVPTTSAAREWVEDGVTGLYFRGGDAADLAQKIVLLRDNAEMATAMGKEAYRRYWRQPATLEKHCQDLEQVYRHLLVEVAKRYKPVRV